MRPSSGEQNAADRRLAAEAGEAGSQVDTVLELEEATHPVGVNIVRDRRPAQPDGVLQDFAEGQPQTFEFGSGQPSTQAARTNSRTKETFVGVNVSHPGEQLLIEQRGFNRQLAPMEKLSKFHRRNRQRVNAGRCEA